MIGIAFRFWIDVKVYTNHEQLFTERSMSGVMCTQCVCKLKKKKMQDSTNIYKWKQKFIHPPYILVYFYIKQIHIKCI